MGEIKEVLKSISIMQWIQTGLVTAVILAYIVILVLLLEVFQCCNI